MKKFFKAVSTILFGMHMWLPIVYSLIFLMIAALSGTIGGSWPFYFIGLALSFLGSLLLVYFVKPRKKEEETAKSVKAATTAEVAFTPVKKTDYLREDTDRTDMSGYVAAEQAKYAGNMSATPSSMYGGYAAPAPAPMPEPDRTAYSSQSGYGDYARPAQPEAHEAIYTSFSSSPSQSQPDTQPTFTPYVQPRNAQSPTSQTVSDYERSKASSYETPKIFRMRVDPNVLVYEYSDRYEKYQQLPSGDRRLISVEYK